MCELRTVVNGMIPYPGFINIEAEANISSRHRLMTFDLSQAALSTMNIRAHC